MARHWVKIWVNESLTGTMRFDFEPAERGVCYDLIVMAGNCRQEGVIAAGPDKPYPLGWIARTLNIALPLLKRTLDKCIKSERIEMNGSGLIKITNWEKYQSEYDRQKGWRQRKKEESQDPDKYIKGRYGHMVRR